MSTVRYAHALLAAALLTASACQSSHDEFAAVRITSVQIDGTWVPHLECRRLSAIKASNEGAESELRPVPKITWDPECVVESFMCTEGIAPTPHIAFRPGTRPMGLVWRVGNRLHGGMAFFDGASMLLSEERVREVPERVHLRGDGVFSAHYPDRVIEYRSRSGNYPYAIARKIGKRVD